MNPSLPASPSGNHLMGRAQDLSLRNKRKAAAEADQLDNLNWGLRAINLTKRIVSRYNFDYNVQNNTLIIKNPSLPFKKIDSILKILKQVLIFMISLPSNKKLETYT